MPAKPTTSASESISAATLAEVRRGAWMRLSAASAPSTGRTHLSSGRSARASASASSEGFVAISPARCATPYTSLMSVPIDAAMPPAIRSPNARPPSEPTIPVTALSARKRPRIWPRVAPSARSTPISERRWVTAIANEL